MPANDLPQSARLELGPTDLHVWSVAIGGAAHDDVICSAEEHARAARFVRAHDGAVFLQAHGALRTVLARYVGAAPRAIAFATGTWGKPELAGAAAHSGIAFNLTHSGAVALIAVARGRAVGIDVEAVRAMPEALAIARRMLGAGAAAALEPLDAAARDHAFLRLWTAHEACIKALGRALAVASEAVRMEVRDGAPVCAWADPGAAPHGLGMAPLATAPGHVAALAWARHALRDDTPRIACFTYGNTIADPPARTCK
jgi:4'-phosphopantetheinyl transferase